MLLLLVKFTTKYECLKMIDMMTTVNISGWSMFLEEESQIDLFVSW